MKTTLTEILNNEQNKLSDIELNLFILLVFKVLSPDIKNTKEEIEAIKAIRDWYKNLKSFDNANVNVNASEAAAIEAANAATANAATANAASFWR